jgi:hypothetical protein
MRKGHDGASDGRIKSAKHCPRFSLDEGVTSGKESRQEGRQEAGQEAGQEEDHEEVLLQVIARRARLA